MTRLFKCGGCGKWSEYDFPSKPEIIEFECTCGFEELIVCN